VEASPVNSHYDPGIWKQDVGLLEGFDVFVPQTIISCNLYDIIRRVFYFELAMFWGCFLWCLAGEGLKKGVGIESSERCTLA